MDKLTWFENHSPRCDRLRNSGDTSIERRCGNFLRSRKGPSNVLPSRDVYPFGPAKWLVYSTPLIFIYHIFQLLIPRSLPFCRVPGDKHPEQRTDTELEEATVRFSSGDRAKLFAVTFWKFVVVPALERWLWFMGMEKCLLRLRTGRRFGVHQLDGACLRVVRILRVLGGAAFRESHDVSAPVAIY